MAGSTDAPATDVKTGIAVPSATPSFEELDSAASDLNEALSGARAKLDELRQATELAAMAAELREELESSIQENNRLAASLAEVQSERSYLESQHSAAKREIVELTQSADASNAEMAELKERLEQRESRIAEIEDARSDAEKQIQSLEVDLDQAGTEISQLSGDITELTGQLEATRSELDDANARSELARTARDDADRELSKVRKQIAGMLRSVLLGGEPIDVSAMEEAEAAEREKREAAALGLTARYEAVRASNVRAEPSPDAERVGFAKRGDFITVIGKVDGRNWFEIETDDGIRGFIFGDLIRPAA
jgi:chromosome segregation ATPase